MTVNQIPIQGGAIFIINVYRPRPQELAGDAELFWKLANDDKVNEYSFVRATINTWFCAIDACLNTVFLDYIRATNRCPLTGKELEFVNVEAKLREAMEPKDILKDLQWLLKPKKKMEAIFKSFVTTVLDIDRDTFSEYYRSYRIPLVHYALERSVSAGSQRDIDAGSVPSSNVNPVSMSSEEARPVIEFLAGFYEKIRNLKIKPGNRRL